MKEETILDDLYEKRKIGFEENFLKKYGEVDETREVQKAESNLTSLIKEIVKDKNEYNKILDGLNKFEEGVICERVFWNEQYYKLGFIDALDLKKEIKEQRNNFSNINDNH